MILGCFLLGIPWVIPGYFWVILGYFSGQPGCFGQQDSWAYKACKEVSAPDPGGGFIASIHILTTPHWETSLVSYFLSCVLRASCVTAENPSTALSFGFHVQLSSLLDGNLWLKNAIFHLKVTLAPTAESRSL